MVKDTLKYIVKRIFLMLLTLLIIVSMCYILIKLLPNTPVKQFGKDMALIEARRNALGYNKPLIEQYFIFLTRTLIQGDWGVSESLYIGQDVMLKFTEKLPSTIMINLYSMIFSVPIGILFGIYAALKKNKWQDYVISTGVILLVSVPSYVFAFLIQYFLCFKLKWFPFLMDAGYDYLSWSMFKSMIPAVLSLSLGTVAGLTRFVRAELTEVLTSDYLLLARMKGLTKAQTTVRHAMRNAMVPIAPSIIGMFIGILSGSLIIEKIFGVPGVGQLYVNSISGLDYNFFMLLSAFYTLIGLAATLVIDVSYGIIDPRIRMGSKK